LTEPLTVTLDPRVSAAAAKDALPKQLKFAQDLGAAMRQCYIAHAEVAKLRADLAALAPQLTAAADANLAASVQALDAKAEQLESKAKDQRNLATINGRLTGLASEAGDGDRAPPQAYLDAFKEYHGYLQAALKQWDDLRKGDLAALDTALKARGLTPVTVVNP